MHEQLRRHGSGRSTASFRAARPRECAGIRVSPVSPAGATIPGWPRFGARLVEIRPDSGYGYIDATSIMYASAPFPMCRPDRMCFLITVEKANEQTLGFVRIPTSQ